MISEEIHLLFSDDFRLFSTGEEGRIIQGEEILINVFKEKKLGTF